MKRKISEKIADKVTDAISAGVQIKEEIEVQKRISEEKRKQEEAIERKKLLKWAIPTICILAVLIGIMAVLEEDTPQKQKDIQIASTEEQQSSSEKAAIETEQAQAKQLDEEKAEISALKGKNLFVVKETLAKKQYVAAYYFDNEADEDNEFNNYTETVSSFTNAELKQWTATEIKNIDPEKKKVVIRIKSAETIQVEKEKEALKEKLPTIDAWIALENYGENEFPYGFDLHYTLGRLAEEPKDKDTWFLKAEVTIKNAYGTEMEAVCEGEVSGTSENPIVEYFNVN